MKVPIQIYLIWNKKFKEGGVYADLLFKKLNKDPEGITLKEVNLPVYYRENFNNINYNNATKTILVLMIDLNSVEDENFGKNLNCFLKESHNKKICLLPITFTKRFSELTDISNFNFLKLIDNEIKIKYKELGFGEEGVEIETFKKEYFLNWISHEVAKEIFSIDSEKKSLQIFLSHTKRDGFGRNKALALKEVIQKGTQSEVFFDENSIHIGNDFERYIRNAIDEKESIIIVILTDSYSKSSWCRREIIWSKNNNKSIIIVNALDKEEERSFPYMGNVRVVRHNEQIPQFSFYKILTQIYLEAIRRKKNHLNLKDIVFDGDIMDDTPELITFFKCEKEKVLYPDPPLPQEEIELLESSGKFIYTPTKLIMEQVNFSEKKIMFSISEDSKYPILPLKTLISDLIKYLIYYDIKILYGGSLTYNPEEYNLLKQMINTLEFYKGAELAAHTHKIINYVPYPLIGLINHELKEDYGSHIKLKEVNPLNLKIEDYLKNMSNFKVWGESLTCMRNKIIEEAEYIIIVGGKLKGYKGKYPGILEEFLISLRKQKPIYIIGSYGGVAKEIINILQGEGSIKLTEGYQLKENSQEYVEYYNNNVNEKYSEIYEEIDSKNIEDLKNGLSVKENEILFNLESSSQIIEIILKGITKLNMG